MANKLATELRDMARMFDWAWQHRRQLLAGESPAGAWLRAAADEIEKLTEIATALVETLEHDCRCSVEALQAGEPPHCAVCLAKKAGIG